MHFMEQELENVVIASSFTEEITRFYSESRQEVPITICSIDLVYQDKRTINICPGNGKENIIL